MEKRAYRRDRRFSGGNVKPPVALLWMAPVGYHLPLRGCLLTSWLQLNVRGRTGDVRRRPRKRTSVFWPSRSRKMATRAPEQTASEMRPAPAASTTRGQTLCMATPQARPDR